MKTSHIVLIVLLGSAIIGVSILGFGLLSLIFKQMAQTEREDNLRTCQRKAASEYVVNWNNQCPRQALDDKDKNCTLPLYLADKIEDMKQKSLDNCIEIFKNSK